MRLLWSGGALARCLPRCNVKPCQPEDLAMATVRYEPWGVVSQLQNEINRVFGNLNDGESSSATAEWVPAVDVREYTDRFQLLIDLPGVEPKEVEITLDN